MQADLDYIADGENGNPFSRALALFLYNYSSSTFEEKTELISAFPWFSWMRISKWFGRGAKVVSNNVEDIVVHFGQNPNQVNHAFRHIDELGLDRSLVQSSIEAHFRTVSSNVVAKKPFNQIIDFNGLKIQYTAFKLSDGTFNIGRIHAID
jgi:hypothetical protein